MKKSGFWYRLITMEPALVRIVILAIIGALASFGITVSDELPDNLITLVLALLALAQWLWVRTAVTSNKKVVVYQPDPIESPEVVLPGEAKAIEASDYEIVEAARSAPADVVTD